MTNGESIHTENTTSPDLFVTPSLEARISIIEERTRPKPKSTLDKIKDWGGVVTLIIAFAYSFPLGLWDRFIVSKEKRQQEEIVQLRNVIDQTSALLIEEGKTQLSLVDPLVKDIVNRAYSSRISILMANNRDKFEKNMLTFSPFELMVIGYNFQSSNQIDLSIPYYIEAQNKAKGDLTAEAEALRLLATARFMKGTIEGTIESKNLARVLYQDSINKALAQGTPNSTYNAMYTATHWGILELNNGDWACGKKQIALARNIYSNIYLSLNDNGQFRNLIDLQVNHLNKKIGQADKGCI